MKEGEKCEEKGKGREEKWDAGREAERGALDNC